MTTNSDPYSRVYWRFRDEYPDVYADDRTFATWMRLLINAEGAHPSAADLPRRVHNATLDKLVQCGLVTLLSGDRYRVKGLENERARRAGEQRNGGKVRAETGERGPDGRYLPTSGGSPAVDTSGGSPANQLSKDEQSKAETSKAETRKEGARGPLADTIEDIYDRIDGNDPVSVNVRRLQKLAAEITGDPFVNVHAGLGLKAVNEQLPHGFDRVEKAWRQVDVRVRAASGLGVKPTLRQLVFGADELLNAVPRPEAQEQREDEAREAYSRRVEKTRRELADYRK